MRRPTAAAWSSGASAEASRPASSWEVRLPAAGTFAPAITKELVCLSLARSGPSRLTVVWTVVLGAVMVPVDATIVNVAITKLAARRGRRCRSSSG